MCAVSPSHNYLVFWLAKMIEIVLKVVNVKVLVCILLLVKKRILYRVAMFAYVCPWLYIFIQMTYKEISLVAKVDVIFVPWI